MQDAFAPAFNDVGIRPIFHFSAEFEEIECSRTPSIERIGEELSVSTQLFDQILLLLTTTVLSLFRTTSALRISALQINKQVVLIL